VKTGYKHVGMSAYWLLAYFSM